tara:strand:- start:33 stop:863 length:831 start_codon:yes stop_codon:yes gene_type:complete
MALEEMYNSGPVLSGTSGATVTLIYLITGATDYDDAVSQLKSGTSTTVTVDGEVISRQDFRADPLECNDLWRGFVEYSRDSTSSRSTNDGDYYTNFSVTTRQSNMLVSYATTATYGAGAPNIGGKLNIDPWTSFPRGAPTLFSDYQFSETHYVSNSSFGSAEMDEINSHAGKVNSVAFTNNEGQTFPIRNALFLGAEGTRRESGQWEVTYRFAIRPNKSRTFDIDGVSTAVTVIGWDYANPFFGRKEPKSNQIVPVLTAVYTEQIFESIDFTGLLP